MSHHRHRPTATVVFTFLLSLVVTLGALSGCVKVDSGPQHIPHQDPAVATLEYDLSSLVSAYTGVLELLISGNYHDIDLVIKDLQSANANSELLGLFDRFSSLSLELSEALSQAEDLLDLASRFITENDPSNAASSLNSAAVKLTQISYIPAEIRVVNESIGVLLNIAVLSGSNSLHQAYQALLDSTDRLQGAIDRLALLREQLAALNSYAQANLVVTELSLTVSPSKVFVGDSIKVFGRLSAGDDNLGGRQITIDISSQVYRTTTGPDGTYEVAIAVPYSYAPVMTIQASYQPLDVDTDIYRIAYSLPIGIEIEYYDTQLAVNLPKELHPGFVFELIGTLSTEAPDQLRNIKVFLNGQLIGTTTAVDSFVLNITPPETIKLDMSLLSISVVPERRYAGTSVNVNMPVTQLPLEVSIDIPGFFLIPGTLNIAGRISGDIGDVSEASIELSYAGKSISVRSDSTGRFKGVLELPINLILFGSQTLEVQINPSEIWYSPLEFQEKIVVVNPISSALIFVLIIILAVAGITRSRNTGVTRHKIAVTASNPAFSLIATEASPINGDGLKNSILRMYLSARQLAQTLTGIFIRPSDTLREYMGFVSKRLPSLTSVFTELTVLAEIMMYSKLEPGQPTLLRTEQLLKSMQRDHKIGPS
ncbi:hypothetical protein DGWBC_0886 [Dehalogenimonas sp. WBC-2]|nr:hypothetical protein DGWBC_0886 [Dehalogenimonas sp. WBC-2]